MQTLPLEPKDGDCGCVYDADTGYFNPCCLKHEREYLDFMQTRAEMWEKANTEIREALQHGT